MVLRRCVPVGDPLTGRPSARWTVLSLVASRWPSPYRDGRGTSARSAVLGRNVTHGMNIDIDVMS